MATEEERHGYCRSTWIGGMLRGQRASPKKCEAICATIDRLLAKQPILVDVRPGDRPEDIIGWCCYTARRSQPVLHFVYVRRFHRGKDMRWQGVGGALVAAAGVDRTRPVLYTHATDVFRHVLLRTKVRAVMVDVAQVIQ